MTPIRSVLAPVQKTVESLFPSSSSQRRWLEEMSLNSVFCKQCGGSIWQFLSYSHLSGNTSAVLTNKQRGSRLLHRPVHGFPCREGHERMGPQ